MNNNFDLRYSDDALLARAIFLSSENDVNIFVEDSNKEYEYEEIFERLFKDKLSINVIFPTGGKQKLIEAYELFGNTSEYGYCFFIADGDFDIAHNIKMISAENFLYLKRYNIESYLLDEKTIIKFMRPKLKKQFCETKSIIDYSTWLNIIDPYFKKLFALYFLVQKYCSTIQNVSKGAKRFINKKGLPENAQYENYKNEFSKSIPNIDVEIDNALLELETIYGSEPCSFVCGKYYIESLSRYLNNLSVKPNKLIGCDEVKAELIRGFDIESLFYLKKEICNYIDSKEL